MLLTALLVGCYADLSPIESAGAEYRRNRSYKSLEVIYKSLFPGMQRKEIERLLGEPDYSPGGGQYYYSSDRSVYVEEQEWEVVVGLVVDYRDKNDAITETLQEFWLGPIGE
ncbi:hypothetical protein [Candidatus Thiosymbion oneisti]|uniref:hypothetical protein n=1 Tax=Candidatus Thiosymbion oneisti TaxID=589554 RepID=UPI00105F182B|nr:hypothetical protein [Candidatus Thiosymbion oneisti]